LLIAIDALGLPRFGGARVSALGWLTALGRYDQANQYLVFLSRPEEVLAPFPNIEQQVVPIPNRFVVRIGAQILLPPLLARRNVDLLHSMKNLSVFNAPCPTVITINDLSHLVLRGLYPWVDRFYWQRIQPQILRRAARIVAISENTKSDLMQFYSLEADKIVTIAPGCDDRFQEPCDHKELERVRAKYRLPGPLLLYVGGLGIHKNVTTLVRAFARVAGSIPHVLVLVGGAHHTTSDHTLRRQVSALGLTDRVRWLDSIPQIDLPCLYRTADLFLLASLNEGFGLVLVEAMASGTPVLAARTGSVAEVVGSAARLIQDPMDERAFAEAILGLLSDPEALVGMSRRGLARSQLFSWRKTAEKTVSLYGSVMRG